MKYAVATTGSQFKFYRFAEDRPPELFDVLDTRHVTVFRSKESAKEAAVSSGLKTWRYVRL